MLPLPRRPPRARPPGPPPGRAAARPPAARSPRCPATRLIHQWGRWGREGELERRRKRKRLDEEIRSGRHGGRVEEIKPPVSSSSISQMPRPLRSEKHQQWLKIIDIFFFDWCYQIGLYIDLYSRLVTLTGTKDKKAALNFWTETKYIFSPGFYCNRDYCEFWLTD